MKHHVDARQSYEVMCRVDHSRHAAEAVQLLTRELCQHLKCTNWADSLYSIGIIAATQIGETYQTVAI